MVLALSKHVFRIRFVTVRIKLQKYKHLRARLSYNPGKVLPPFTVCIFQCALKKFFNEASYLVSLFAEPRRWQVIIELVSLAWHIDKSVLNRGDSSKLEPVLRRNVGTQANEEICDS